MEHKRIITSMMDFDQDPSSDRYYMRASENPYTEESLGLSMGVLDALVELVGSEEEVEDCCREALEELEASQSKENEYSGVEFEDTDTPASLALAAAIVKCVQRGKISQEEADRFISEYL